MVATPKSGLVETTSTTGTGDYLLDGKTGIYRGWQSGDNLKVYHYCARNSEGFEIGKGTVTIGAQRKLSRDEIIANHLETTAPVNWGNGSKEISLTLPAERVAMTDVPNIWRANQFLRANTLYFDSDDDTYLVASSDDVLILYAGGNEIARWDGPNASQNLWFASDAVADGPILNLQRSRQSPGANQALGVLAFSGRDGAGSMLTYARLACIVTSAGAGATGGQLRLQAMQGGSMRQALTVGGQYVTAEANVSFYTNAKTGSDFSAVGAELRNDGIGAFTVQDNICILVNRKGSDGGLVDLRRDNTSIGGITVASGVVSYNTFTGAHESEWSLPSPEHEALGTLVSVADGLYDGREQLPLVAVTRRARDPRVYGVVAQRLPFDDRPGLSRIIVHALGTGRIKCRGPVRAGDLLESSDLPGVAQAQADDLYHAHTVAKATQDSPDDGSVRLVPCVLQAG